MVNLPFPFLTSSLLPMLAYYADPPPPPPPPPIEPMQVFSIYADTICITLNNLALCRK